MNMIYNLYKYLYIILSLKLLLSTIFNTTDMKMDGKTLMKQNYETLIDISILDKVKIISLRNSVLQFEKEGEMVK